MRIAPPGRTSNAQTGLVKCFGPHHCATCFGSVHALNTRSRGASKMRVMTSSRCCVRGSDDIAVVSALEFVWVIPVISVISVILLLLLLKLLEVVLQAVHALVPEPAILLHP